MIWIFLKEDGKLYQKLEGLEIPECLELSDNDNVLYDQDCLLNYNAELSEYLANLRSQPSILVEKPPSDWEDRSEKEEGKDFHQQKRVDFSKPFQHERWRNATDAEFDRANIEDREIFAIPILSKTSIIKER